MDGKVRYLDNGKVMEADAAEVARWYMSCLRSGDFTPKPPGTNKAAKRVDYTAESLSDYDDAQYFLEGLADFIADDSQREELLSEIEEFLNE